MASIRKQVTTNVMALDAKTPAREAARLMADKQVGSVAVKEGDQITGLVTERDLVATIVAKGDDGTLPIGKAMRPGIPRISADAQEGDAAAMMRDHFTRHLLVEDGGKVVGVVSMKDIIQLMLDEKQFMISQLNVYIHGR